MIRLPEFWLCVQWRNQYFRNSRMRSSRIWRRPQKMKIFKKKKFSKKKFSNFFFLSFFLQICCQMLQITANLRPSTQHFVKKLFFRRISHFLAKKCSGQFFQKSDLSAGGGRRQPARNSRKIAVTPLCVSCLFIYLQLIPFWDSKIYFPCCLHCTTNNDKNLPILQHHAGCREDN